MGLITKSDCMGAKDLNHAARLLCHVVDVCSKVLRLFMTIVSLTCLIKKSWELFLVVFGWETTKTQFCATAWPVSKTFASKSHVTNKKCFERTATESAALQDTTKISEKWQINCVFRLSLGLSTQILEVEYTQAYKMIETGVLVWKSNNNKPYQSLFLLW